MQPACLWEGGNEKGPGRMCTVTMSPSPEVLGLLCLPVCGLGWAWLSFGCPQNITSSQTSHLPLLSFPPGAKKLSGIWMSLFPEVLLEVRRFPLCLLHPISWPVSVPIWLPEVPAV